MSNILKSYGLSTDDYKALTLRAAAILSVLRIDEQHKNRLASNLINYYFTVLLANAETCSTFSSNPEYKKFGPNEFVDWLSYFESRHAVEFSFNPKQLLESLKKHIEEVKQKKIEAGWHPETARIFCTESLLYSSQPNYLRMLYAVLQNEVHEQLKREGVIGDSK